MSKRVALCLALALALLAAEAVEARRELLVPGKGKGKGPSTAGKNKCGAVGANGEPGTCAACAGNSSKCKKCNKDPAGRGFYPANKKGCIGCKDVNCKDCGNGGQCKACVPGFALKGNKCILCTDPDMTIKKGRCKCPDGMTFAPDNSACVPKVTA